jgi:hypothetical protein
MVTPDGIVHYEELRKKSPDSPQGFVAMCFSPQLREVYDKAFELALLDAGYKSRRMDLHIHSSNIIDEMLVEIGRSRFMVADLTNHKGGVYFEAGYAMGLGLRVIFTCHEEHKAGLHFDVQQFPHLYWTEPEGLRKILGLRVERLVGRGPVRSGTS